MQGRGRNTKQEVPPENVVLVAGVDDTSIPMRYWNCNDWGHGSNNCPKPRQVRSGTSSVQIGITFSQCGEGEIPSTWILLDTCFTDSVIFS